METSLKTGLQALTEKEKQTLRLIVRGHDAKSVARDLGLSVHTINERLREARRKLSVSSSREAARILLAFEGNDAAPPAPDMSGDVIIGEDRPCTANDEETASIPDAGQAKRRSPLLLGACLMTFAIALLMVAGLPQAGSPPTTSPVAAARNAETVDLASAWLGLLDQARWEESYRATGSSFRELNTLKVWIKASEQARTPLGALVSRVFISQENLPAPPAGYEVLKFRTQFANKPDAVETVALDREGGVWRVVGVTIG